GDPGGIEETEGFQAVVGPAQHVHVQDAGAATQARQGVVEGVDVVALAVTRGGECSRASRRSGRPGAGIPAGLWWAGTSPPAMAGTSRYGDRSGSGTNPCLRPPVSGPSGPGRG